MALLRKKYSEIPSDAVVLSEDEALKYQTQILNKWKHSSDVLAYRYGGGVLGVSSFIAGFFINNYYRNKFKLLHYGRASSYLPMCVIPAAFSAVTHMEFVLKNVVLQKRDTCPVCLEMRASAIQAGLGCVFPIIMGPLNTLLLAQRYLTYDIPYVSKEPMKVLRLVKKMTQPVLNVWFGIFIGQALLASVVTHLEAKSVITVNKKLEMLEEELENSGV
ncbi:DUF1370 domain containing protein [Asbolus verrucosus]|uniref:DUF1370 domain containing protein n=1 Tax=Asbolus verrucosus TaxID=1661398 RepID=A0A482W2K1_ASBVE|nr:DUF1370 domain containing protein [Asbolus verrucosus]